MRVSDSKSPHVSRTFLSILADFSNVVVWMVLILSLILNSSSLLSKPLGIIPSAPTIIGITVTLIFHSFFTSLVRSKYFSVFSISFILTAVVWNVKIYKLVNSLFLLLIKNRSILLADIRWSIRISKSQRILFITFSRMDVCAYIILLYGQVSIFCTIPRGSPSLPTHDWSCTPFVLVCCIYLLSD